MKTASCLLFTIQLMAAGMAYAAEPRLLISQYTRTSWSEKDGLPSDHVGAIAQDADGYLWLGTTVGLTRFDGVRFVLWASHPALRSAEVTALCVGKDGALWVGLGGGGGVLRVHDANVTAYGRENGLAIGRVIALFQDRSGAIWAAGRSGVFRYDGTRWAHLTQRDGVPAATILSMYLGPTRTIWVGTGQGVFAKVPSEPTFVLRSPPTRRVIAFTEDSQRALWVTDPEHAVQPLRPGSAGGSVSTDLANTVGMRLLSDTSDNIWIGTLGRGLFRLYRPDATTAIAERFSVQDGLAGDVIWSLLQDREGNIWVGTDTGLTRISRSEVVSITSTDHRSNVVRSVAMGPDGSVWASTANGLLNFVDGRERWYGLKDGLPSVGITAVHASADGSIWIATQTGLARYRNGRISPIPLPRSGPQALWIDGIAIDDQGALWLNDADDALFRFKSPALTPFHPRDPSGRQRVVSIFADRQGRVWSGFADGGLAEYSAGATRFYGETEGLAAGRVDAIFEDSRGIVWVGTSVGLSRFKNERMASIGGSDAFPVASPTGIVEDDDGFIWVGVHSGIIRFAPAEFERALGDPAYHPIYRFLNTEGALAGTPIRRNFPAAAGGHSALWFASANGFSVVNPRARAVSRAAPLVKIEDAAIDDRAIVASPQFAIPHSVSRLQISYTAIALTAPDKIHFRYMLEGFDDAWVNNGTSRRAVYTHLPPGRYRFRVMASDAFGEWTEARAPWSFSIEPAYYQRWSFYVALACTGMMLLYVMWRMRLRQLRMKYELVIAERTRIAREIHDTLLQSQVAMALQLDSVATWLTSAPELVHPALIRLRKHVERYTREARESILDLRSPSLAVRDLSTVLRESGEAIAATKGVRFDFSTSGMPVRCSPRVAEQILRVGEEAVSNAVRHAEARLVRMELGFDAHEVTLRISDDGRGFDPVHVPHTPRRHWGLTNMEERAQQIGAHLSLRSEPGTGTTVELTTPIGAHA